MFSWEAGFTKPKTEIFIEAATRLGLSLDEILMVGDSRFSDFHGARAAGMSAVLLDRNSRHQIDPSLATLAGLLPYLEALTDP